MKVKWVLAGAGISALLTLMLTFVIAVIEYYTGFGENAAVICVYFAAAASVFAGAFTAVRFSGEKAFFHAMAVAVIYIIGLVIASLAVNGRINTDMHCVSVMLGALMAGFLGAVCGK